MLWSVPSNCLVRQKKAVDPIMYTYIYIYIAYIDIFYVYIYIYTDSCINKYGRIYCMILPILYSSDFCLYIIRAESDHCRDM